MRRPRDKKNLYGKGKGAAPQMRTATDRAIMFSSDAVNVKQSSDGSELTVRLQPAVSVGLQSDATISVDSFRFINHVPNVSAAIEAMCCCNRFSSADLASACSAASAFASALIASTFSVTCSPSLNATYSSTSFS